MSNPDDLQDNLAYEYESGSDDQSGPQDKELLEPQHALDEERGITVGDKGVEQAQKRVYEDKDGNVSKRQKKLTNSKFHARKKEQREYDIMQKKSIPKSSPEVIVEYFAKLIREHNPDLSPLELNDMYFKKSDFLSTEKFEDARNLTNFPAFLTQFSKAPKCIIFSMSNMRVADIFRSLSGTKNCLKLFAKNKLKEDLTSVEQSFASNRASKSKNKSQNIECFITTPTRLEKILESTDSFFEGKDKLDIILDSSYLDSKDNTLLKCENTKVLYKALKLMLAKKSSVKILLY